jgi:hypothetical protein
MSTNDKQRPGARLPGPTVFRLVSQHQYREAVVALHERPQDASYVGYHGDTALHVMCRLTNCPRFLIRAVEAILDVDPKLVAKPNQLGWTPLHFASVNLGIQSVDRPAWEKVVMRLMEAYPAAAAQPLPRNLQAKTPFHLACAANASSTILSAMLTAAPELATLPFLQVSETSTAGYPLFLLWNAVERPDDWPKMELLLRAAVGAPLRESTQQPAHTTRNNDLIGPNSANRFDVLNAACQVNPCPREYLSILVQRYPNRASWTDSHGLLPLHYVIMHATKNRRDGTEKFLIQSLLQAYPAGASCLFVNMNPPLLPLHYLVSDSEANWPEYGLDDLIQAYPEALRIPDPRTGLVPALASAPFAIHSRLHLTATFNLLLKSPELFETWSKHKSNC